MKLSKAIRAGAKLRPMGYDYYFFRSRLALHGDDTIHSCAIGAAWEATGFNPEIWFNAREPVGLPSDLFSELDDCWFDEPDHEPVTLHDIIQDMNDSKKWTREEIADWLESIGQ